MGGWKQGWLLQGQKQEVRRVRRGRRRDRVEEAVSVSEHRATDAPGSLAKDPRSDNEYLPIKVV